ncbi:MAG: hypothetical protein AB8H80_04140 [Planctomycetota bacterium]
MEAVANSRPNIFLRIVDISTRGSEAGAQHGIRAVPTLWLYSDGKKVAGSTKETFTVLNEMRNGG